ncbi:hypothetical protein [Actinomadura rayongensis]|uniref:Uncharacterized protein n=1 Tax=Actinomadura rayongensis TaxID=1429076 RepID=A0A6I4WA93_9ACTN|nr:hypothetical protein [Actinomadura rayongensis]MXQ64986.1 hypothetical protein [Actinomadura rayongensis]
MVDVVAGLLALQKVVGVSRDVWALGSGGPMVEILGKLADVDAKAAVRAVGDGRFAAAEALLYGAYEKQVSIAEGPHFANFFGRHVGFRDVVADARYGAAGAALAAAEVARLGNTGVRATWLTRAKENFDAWDERAKEPPPSNNLSRTAPMVDGTITPSDYEVAERKYKRYKKKRDAFTAVYDRM